jgi:hypothetical protein
VQNLTVVLKDGEILWMLKIKVHREISESKYNERRMENITQ